MRSDAQRMATKAAALCSLSSAQAKQLLVNKTDLTRSIFSLPLIELADQDLLRLDDQRQLRIIAALQSLSGERMRRRDHHTGMPTAHLLQRDDRIAFIDSDRSFAKFRTDSAKMIETERSKRSDLGALLPEVESGELRASIPLLGPMMNTARTMRRRQTCSMKLATGHSGRSKTASKSVTRLSKTAR